MKRIIMACLLAWLGMVALTAQEVKTERVDDTHDVKGVVTDYKERPVVGALVRVEGTDISTVTDIDGKFLLREVPMGDYKIVVESVGMETAEWETETPIQLPKRRTHYSFVVSAGMNISRYTVNGGSFKPGYEVGIGVDMRYSKHGSFCPMVQLTSRGSVYESGIYKETWNPMMLDFPLFFRWRYKLAYKTNLVMSLGPVLSWGFSGKVTRNVDGEETELNIYKKEHEYENYYDDARHHSLLYPFSFGVAYGLGVEYKRLMIGVTGKNMALPVDDYGMTLDDGEHNWSLTFGVSYRL